MSRFDALSFWDRRHARNYGPESVGYAGLGVPFNNWMYRVRERVVRRNLRRQGIQIRDRDVFDIGSGTGFYVRLWESLAAKSVTGSDFSPYAVTALKDNFPQHKFFQLDISRTIPVDLGTFDIISAFDILYHIVDDASYARAIANISTLVRPGGYFIFSEHTMAMRESHLRQVYRTEPEVISLLFANGFEPILRAPMFVLMNWPMRSASAILATHWRIVSSLIERKPTAAKFTGPLLYPIEIAILSLKRRAPSTEIFICRRR